METGLKIKTRQIYILFLLAGFSPAVRLTSALCAKLGGQAGWVSVILSGVFFTGYAWLLRRVFTGKFTGRCLYTLYIYVVGKIGGKALMCLYSVWFFILTVFYLRVFAERFTTSIMASTSLSFFLITMLIICIIMLSGKSEHFIRLATICFFILLPVFVFIPLFNANNINVGNFLPITVYDTMSITRAAYPLLGVISYFGFLMLTSDEVEEERDPGRQALWGGVMFVFTNLSVFLTTVGVFGSELTQKLSLPFFMSVKIIKLFGTLERLESIFLILWTAADIAMIMMFMHLLIKVLGKLINLEKPDILKAPILLSCYVFALFFADNMFEISEFSEKVALAVNILLGIILPCIMLMFAYIKRDRLKTEES